MAHKWPSTEREFLRRFPVGESSTIHDLPPELKSASGSSWSAKHLQACRVLLQDHGHGLPILMDYMATAAAHVAADQSRLVSLISFSYEEIRSLPYRALRSVDHFGSFFVSLADVARMRNQDLPTRRLRENIRAPERPNFRSGEGEGFSSSPPMGSSHLSERPDIEEQIDRKKHEVVSANMAAQFISIVIDLYLNQPIESITTEFSNAPNTFYLDSPQFNCICQDDGAIWHRKFNPITKTWINPQSTLLCSLEAKSSYSQVDSSEMGVTSDRTLAQEFCELLGPVLSQVIDGEYEALDDEQRCRFLISVHQSDIMIVYCDFSLEYLGYMYSDQPPLHLPYITLHRSRKYDLGDPTERREAAETIVALGEYFKQTIITALVEMLGVNLC